MPNRIINFITGSWKTSLGLCFVIGPAAAVISICHDYMPYEKITDKDYVALGILLLFISVGIILLAIEFITYDKRDNQKIKNYYHTDFIPIPSNKFGIKEASVAIGCVEKIKAKKEEIVSLRIMAISGNTIIKLLKPVIEYVVSEKNARVQIIIGTEFSDFVQETESLEDNTNRKGEISKEIGGVTNYLKEFSQEAYKKKRTHRGCIEVKKFNTQLRNSITIINDDWAWVTLHLPPQRCAQSLSLEFSQEGKTPYIKSISTHFDCVWESIERIDYRSYVEDGRLREYKPKSV